MLGNHGIVESLPSAFSAWDEDWCDAESSSSYNTFSASGSRNLESFSPPSSIAESDSFDFSLPFLAPDQSWMPPAYPLSLGPFSTSAPVTSVNEFSKLSFSDLDLDTFDACDSWNTVQSDIESRDFACMSRTPSSALSEPLPIGRFPDNWSVDSPVSVGSVGSVASVQSSSASSAHTCPTCDEVFSRVTDIEDHARDTKHKPFICIICNTGFSRQDALSRHREIHESPKSQKCFSCDYCEKYQGQGAFRRRDHLRQHLRKKHRVNPNADMNRHRKAIHERLKQP